MLKRRGVLKPNRCRDVDVDRARICLVASVELSCRLQLGDARAPTIVGFLSRKADLCFTHALKVPVWSKAMHTLRLSIFGITTIYRVMRRLAVFCSKVGADGL